MHQFVWCQLYSPPPPPLDSAGVLATSGKNIVDDSFRTSNPNIFAVGDVVQGKPELAAVTLMAGRLIARQMFANEQPLYDFRHVPRTLLSCMEYASVGSSEEKAVAEHGAEKIETYHAFFQPIEFIVMHRPVTTCYLKAISLRDGPYREVKKDQVYFLQ